MTIRPTLLLASVALALLAGCGRGEAGGDRAAAGASTTATAAATTADATLEPGPGGWYGTPVPPSMPAPALRLAEPGGRPFDLAAERGRVVLVFFGYTNCPDICPTTLAQWKRVEGRLGADSAKVRFVFVSVDPERDTPEIAKAYAQRFDSSFVGLTGTRAEVEAAERGFRVSSFREPAPTTGATGHAAHDPHAAHAPAGYTVAHTSRVFVIDPSGRWRLILPASASADAMLSDVRRLVRE
jgi:protein SCO1/2